MKALLLSFLMLSAILVSGLGIYAADAAAKFDVSDGYGITAMKR